ncbi:MAG: AAA family ATPase, partial [Spirochaetota bacterium]
MKVLRGVLSDLRESGTGSCVIIHGAPGVGRSRILDEFAEGSLLPEETVLRISLSPSFRQKPYGTVYLLLDSYLSRIQTYSEKKKNDLRKAILVSVENSASMIGAIHPGFADFIMSSPDKKRVQDSEEKGRFTDMVCRMISNITRFENGLIVIADDTHFCDRASIGLMERNIQALAGTKILFIGSFRDVPGISARGDYPRIFSPDNDFLCDLTIFPFDRAAHRRFCAGLFGCDEQSAEAAADFIYEKTGGNSLMSKEIAAYLLNADAVYLSGASLVFDEKKCAS